MENAIIRKTSERFSLCWPDFLFTFLLLLLLFFLCIATKVNADATISINQQQQEQLFCGVPFNNSRLPVRLAPVNYDLQIEINEQPNDSFFSGSVTITLKQTQDFTQLAKNQIALHADSSLQIISASYREISENLTRQNEELLESICRDTFNQLLVFTMKRDIKGSTGKLHMKFSGVISYDMRGLYKSSYTTTSNHITRHRNLSVIQEQHQLLTTQFESMEARRVFPCFDEPALKASFELTLIYPASSKYHTVLSNWEPKLKSRLDTDEFESPSKKEMIKFARTPPMSTYLVAFVLGELDQPITCVPTSGSRVKIRLHAPLYRANEGTFALKIACRAIPVLEEYLGIELSLRKLDLVSVPRFEAGAMENWGLVTFKESQLLVDEENSLPSIRRSVAATVVHEIAHHWFGNLLTMNWWNDVWLNEGFATWAEFQFLDMIAPELQFRDSYILDSHVYAMREDSHRTALPVRAKPDRDIHANNIDQLFSPISYNKAASLVRILHDQILGPERFKRGIRAYLNKHKFSSASTEDLWDALEEVSKVPIGKLMDSWVNQPGHPLVQVELRHNRELVFRQERFLVPSPSNDQEVTKKEFESQLWNILISMRIFGTELGEDRREMNTVHNTLLESKQASMKLPLWFNATHGSGHWIKLNTNFIGFYRVSYSNQLLSLLEYPIRERMLSLADRINIINDAVFLWSIDRIEGGQYLKLLSSFEQDPSELVVSSLVDAFRELLMLFKQTNQQELYTQLTHFIRHTLSQGLAYLFEQLPDAITPIVNDEQKNEGTAAALHMLIDLNYEPAIKFTLNEFSRTRALDHPLEPWIRSPAFFAVARHGSEDEFSKLIQGLSPSGGLAVSERTTLLEELAGALDRDRLSALYAHMVGGGDDSDSEERSEVEASTILELMLLSSDSGRSFVQLLFEQQADILVTLCKSTDTLNALASELAKSMGRASLSKMADLLAPLLEDDWLTTERQLERHFAKQETRLARNAKSMRDFLTSALATDTNGT